MNYMTLGYENMITIFLTLISFVIVMFAQIKINSTYSKYKSINSKKEITGQETARIILDKNGLNDIHIVEVKGNLTDHYDPSRKVIKLSSEIFNGTSIASIAVAAHEVGHAIQDKENYKFMRIRSLLVPVVNFISYLGYFVIIISLLAGITGYLLSGIFIILATLAFQLITLPVEFDASNRARNELSKIIESDEIDGVSSMLSAAAMTYVAGVISSLLNLFRLIIMLNDRDN